jgi:hypothetical protein
LLGRRRVRQDQAADPVFPEPRQDQDSGNNIGAKISLVAVSVNNKKERNSKRGVGCKQLWNS